MVCCLSIKLSILEVEIHSDDAMPLGMQKMFVGEIYSRARSTSESR